MSLARQLDNLVSSHEAAAAAYRFNLRIGGVVRVLYSFHSLAHAWLVLPGRAAGIGLAQTASPLADAPAVHGWRYESDASYGAYFPG